MTAEQAIGLALVWASGTILVGAIARSRGRSAGTWAGLPIFCSPIGGAIALAIVGVARPARSSDAIRRGEGSS